MKTVEKEMLSASLKGSDVDEEIDSEAAMTEYPWTVVFCIIT